MLSRPVKNSKAATSLSKARTTRAEWTRVPSLCISHIRDDTVCRPAFELWDTIIRCSPAREYDDYYAERDAYSVRVHRDHSRTRVGCYCAIVTVVAIASAKVVVAAGTTTGPVKV